METPSPPRKGSSRRLARTLRRKPCRCLGTCVTWHQINKLGCPAWNLISPQPATQDKVVRTGLIRCRSVRRTRFKRKGEVRENAVWARKQQRSRTTAVVVHIDRMRALDGGKSDRLVPRTKNMRSNGPTVVAVSCLLVRRFGQSTDQQARRARRSRINKSSLIVVCVPPCVSRVGLVVGAALSPLFSWLHGNREISRFAVTSKPANS